MTVAQPTSANPFPVALAFALCAVLAGARGKPVAAGLLAALAAYWRPDIGVIAALAAVVALLAARGTARAAGGPLRPRPLTAVLGSVGAVRAVRRRGGHPKALGRAGGIAAGTGSCGGCRSRSTTTGSLRGVAAVALAEDLKDVLGFYLPLAGSCSARSCWSSSAGGGPGPSSPG